VVAEEAVEVLDLAQPCGTLTNLGNGGQIRCRLDGNGYGPTITPALVEEVIVENNNGGVAAETDSIRKAWRQFWNKWNALKLHSPPEEALYLLRQWWRWRRWRGGNR